MSLKDEWLPEWMKALEEKLLRQYPIISQIIEHSQFTDSHVFSVGKIIAKEQQEEIFSTEIIIIQIIKFM